MDIVINAEFTLKEMIPDNAIKNITEGFEEHIKETLYKIGLPRDVNIMNISYATDKKNCYKCRNNVCLGKLSSYHQQLQNSCDEFER